MTFSMIGRADDGGLGVMTQEIARHLQPDRVLVPRLEGGSANRDGFDVSRFTGDGGSSVREEAWDGGMFSDSSLRWVVDEVQAVYTAETCYDERLAHLCAERGVRLFIHAMPELFGPELRAAQELGARILLPTSWERHRFNGDTRILPVPVARDRLPGTERRTIKTFLHPSAPAMLDRNGTDLVREAIGHVKNACTLIVSGPGAPKERTRVGVVDVVPLDHQRNYWQVYEDADALVLPRRYGGLSLPMQEAASCGFPIVTTRLSPQDEWVNDRTMVVCDDSRVRSATMKGGRFYVHDADPLRVANVMDALLTDEEMASAASNDSTMHAVRLDWKRMTPVWSMDLSL